MRSNTFNYSFLAVGIAAVLGLSTAANAVETPSTTTGVDIINQASASYNVSGQEQPVVLSNPVTVSVSQQARFSLTANNNDTGLATGAVQGDDKNENVEVAPNGFVLFKHTLKNTGNLTDTYNIKLGSADGKYIQNESKIAYKVYSADGLTVIREDDNLPYVSGKSIPSTLEKGQYIEIIINAKTLGNKGKETLALQISATSTFLAGVAGAANTLTNNNTSFTRLPTFGIVKTITNGLDLNNINDTAEYQVVVTNQSTDFDTDATAVDIADFLPAGLVLAAPITDIRPSSTATAGTVASGTTGDSGFNITGNSIPVGQSITILFTVKKGGSGTLVPETAINHVTVTDDLDNDTATLNTLVDSTDVNKEQNVGAFYPTTNVEFNYTDGVERTLATGDDSTGPLSIGGTIKRALTLTEPTFKEIAPTSGTLGQVTHTTVITNTGKDIEGSKAGELTFTITDNDGGARDAINIEPGSVTVTYDADGVGSGAAGSAIPIGFTTVGGVNVYDIYSVLPGGIAPNGGTVTINYNVSSLNAPLGTTTPTFENTIVTLIPKLEGAPTVAPITDKTTVRGLVLLKTQAIDADCTGTPAAGAFVSTDIVEALPGQCIVYKIQAQNTSSTTALPTGLGFEITDIIISDELTKFSANADYVDLSATTTVAGGSATNNGTAITTTIDTLAPQATETMQFKVKIKTGTVTP